MNELFLPFLYLLLRIFSLSDSCSLLRIEGLKTLRVNRCGLGRELFFGLLSHLLILEMVILGNRFWIEEYLNKLIF